MFCPLPIAHGFNRRVKCINEYNGFNRFPRET